MSTTTPEYLRMAHRYEHITSVDRPLAGVKQALFELDNELLQAGENFRFTAFFFPQAGETDQRERLGRIFLTQRVEPVIRDKQDERVLPYRLYTEQTLMLTDTRTYSVLICPPNNFNSIFGFRKFQSVDPILRDGVAEIGLKLELERQNGSLLSVLGSNYNEYYNKWFDRLSIESALQTAMERIIRQFPDQPIPQSVLLLNQLFKFYGSVEIPYGSVEIPLDIRNGETLEQRISEAIVQINRMRNPQELPKPKGRLHFITGLLGGFKKPFSG